MVMRIDVPRKSIEFGVNANTTDEFDPPTSDWFMSEPQYLTFKLTMDGYPLLTFPEVSRMHAENIELFAEFRERLDLLERILHQADTFGTAVVVRGIQHGSDQYEIIPAGDFRIVSEDPDDRG